LKSRIELDSGQVFEGLAVCGTDGGIAGSIVFNTSMTGITEIITDPASSGQILTLTYPMIGNTGVSYDDYQSDDPKIAALIVSELSEIESNFRSDDSLRAVLERSEIPIITGVDTRSIVRLLRSGEAPRARITFDGGDTCREAQPLYTGFRRSISADRPIASLAVPDTGLRRDLERLLVSLGVSLEIFPPSAELKGEFDGYLLPGGPGDPAGYDLTFIKDILKTGKPIFAVGLGHQLLALARGGKTVPLSPGHRGANIPVYGKKTDKSVITIQNHGFAVDPESVDKDLISHVNVNDGSVEGIRWSENIIAVQFQPDEDIVGEFAGMLKR
jgi:carbamoyl-phosphate synthase small subunit